ncbi:MAG: c-type cytochrome [Gammaproteobacteria bacterium]|nr:c-type cytochrome [Gammaproteobacteria bacterium]
MQSYSHSHYLAITLITTVLLLGSTQAQATEITPASMLANSCAGCHGTDGHSPGAIPAIAGKSTEFIETALKDFRSGNKASTVMERHAKGYTDEEIKLLAEYFASQK